MLHFMYRFDYDASGNDQGRASPTVFNVRVYSIADKYDVPGLKSYAKRKFEKAVETCWDMDDFPHAITEIYSSTPAPDRGLRDLVIEVACKHIDALLEKQVFQDVLEEAVGFAAGVTQAMAKEADSALKKYRCPNCSKIWQAVLSSGNTYYCIRCGSSRSNWEPLVVE